MTTTITVPRELLEHALNWVTLNAWHPDDCDVFDLDDDGRHCACSCGMTTLIEALTAALAQQAEPSGWRPIAEAPKDAIILLGFTPSPRMTRRVYEGRWNEEQQTWTSVNGFLIHSDATHWQPLPNPPESSNG